METKEMLERLISAGEMLRTYQKNYFREKDKAIKKTLLLDSKRLEIEFDNIIFNFKQRLK